MRRRRMNLAGFIACTVHKESQLRRSVRRVPCEQGCRGEVVGYTPVCTAHRYLGIKCGDSTWAWNSGHSGTTLAFSSRISYGLRRSEMVQSLLEGMCLECILQFITRRFRE